MKLEQAIRWRGERGFEILAASPGITPSHAKMLEMFSDVMRPLFLEQGDCILTLGKRDNGYVLSQCSLRYDGGGRGAVFTHGVFFSGREYQRDPKANLFCLLSHLPKWESRYDPDLQKLPVLETGAGSRETDDLGGWAEGVGFVSPQGRARFLLLAAKALGGSGALTIETKEESCQKRIKKIISYAGYLADSLPKKLLEGLTFSSGADYRQKLSLTCHREGIGAPAPLYRFLEEANAWEEEEDPLLYPVFLTLASLEGEEKQEVLDRMDAWLLQLGTASIRPELLVCSFYLTDAKALPALEAGILNFMERQLLRYKGQGRICQDFLQEEIHKAAAARGGMP